MIAGVTIVGWGVGVRYNVYLVRDKSFCLISSVWRFLRPRPLQCLRRLLSQTSHFFLCLFVSGCFEGFMFRAIMGFLRHIRTRGVAFITDAYAIVKEDQSGFFVKALLARFIGGTAFYHCGRLFLVQLSDVFRGDYDQSCRIQSLRGKLFTLQIDGSFHVKVLFFRFRCLFR